MRKLRVVSQDDTNDDDGWRFAPAGVLSQYKRDAINIDQADKFARAFDTALVKYKQPVTLPPDQCIEDPDMIAQLYASEPRLWGYFVEGAPANITENLKAVKKLVNCTPALLDSLLFVDNLIPQSLLNAYAAGGCQVVELELHERPLAAGVRVSGGQWYGVELDDLTNLAGDCSIAVGHVVIPLLKGKSIDTVILYGMYAAVHCVPSKVTTKGFPFMLAFAVTFFKLQGRTRHWLPKLILSICERPVSPYMDLCSFYVLVSRVRAMKDLRLLQYDPGALQAQTNLKHTKELQARERGCDGDGYWNCDLAVAAPKAAESQRLAAISKKRKNTKERAATKKTKKSRSELVSRRWRGRRGHETRRNIHHMLLPKQIQRWSPSAISPRRRRS